MAQKNGPEGFDINTLITETPDETEFNDDGDPVAPEKEQPEPEVEIEDDAEEMTAEDIQKLVSESVKKALAETGDEEVEVEDERTPEQKRIAELEAEKSEREQKAEQAKVEHEVKSAIGKLRMTQEQVDLTVLYFEKNPDLEGVVSFEKAALRANPELSTRHQPNRGANGATEGGEVAEVITRGAGGPGARTPFKPVAGRGSYAAVTAAIRSSSAVRSIFRVE